MDLLWDNITHLHIEPTTACNAACPQCARHPTSSYYTHPNLNSSQIWTLEQVKQRLPKEDLTNVTEILINGVWGDAITNLETVEIIKYLSNENRFIRFNTNGSARNAEFWQELAKVTGLYINFAIDGLADTHSLYRRNTDFNKIIHNAKLFIEAGGKAEWTMTIFKHNQHQVETCRAMAKELGFVSFVARHNDRQPTVVIDRKGNVSHVLENADHSPIGPKEPTSQFILLHRETHYKTQDSKKITHIPKGDKFPLPDYRTCDSLKSKSIYIGGDWHVAPCCFFGAVSIKQGYDEQTYLTALEEAGRTIEGQFATNEKTVRQVVEQGFSFVFDRLLNENIIFTCYNHCHPKDSAFRISQDNLESSVKSDNFTVKKKSSWADSKI